MLRFVHKILSKTIEQHIEEKASFRKQLVESGFNAKKFKNYQSESKEGSHPLICDKCNKELYLHYFLSYREEDKKNGVWFCQKCILVRIKQKRSLFPKYCVGYLRYNEESLRAQMRKLGRKTEVRSYSQQQEDTDA